MKYMYVEPQVCGSLGEKSIENTRVHPSIVTKLDYEFDTWPLSHLIETFPVFIVSEEAKSALLSEGLTATS